MSISHTPAAPLYPPPQQSLEMPTAKQFETAAKMLENGDYGSFSEYIDRHLQGIRRHRSFWMHILKMSEAGYHKRAADMWRELASDIYETKAQYVARLVARLTAKTAIAAGVVGGIVYLLRTCF